MGFVHHHSLVQPHGVLFRGYKRLLEFDRQVLRIPRCEVSGGDLSTDEDPKKKKKLKILIAGGGIGGLVYALAAKRSGFDVTVFEKDLTAARGEGRDRGPIQLSSSGLNLLQSIDKDVAMEIMEASHSGEGQTGIADGTTGQWLAEIDFKSPAIRKGLPLCQIICRVELQTILLNAVGEDVVVNKANVVDFVSDAKKVTVFLENGEHHHGDVLVGADGIRSVVRTKLFGPDKEPKYSNYACYTGVHECLPENRFAYKCYNGINKNLLALDIGKGRMQWYAIVREENLGRRHVSSQGYKKMLLERYGDWCDEVVTMISRTEEETIIRRPIYDIDMMSTWGKGRVILLGDAAHAMLPFLGLGGSMAIEDCYWLMVELQNLARTHATPSEISRDEISAARRRFENKRMLRVTTIHTLCRMIGEVGSHYRNYLIDTGPLELFIGSAALRVRHPAFLILMKLLQLGSPTLLDWLCSFESQTSSISYFNETDAVSIANTHRLG